MATRTEEGKSKEQTAAPQGQSRDTGRAMAPAHQAMAPAQHRGMARYGGREPFHQFRREMARLFDQFFRGWAAPWEGGGRDGWGLDMHEDDNAVTVRAEAPGFEPSEFDIQVRGDELVLRAAHRTETEEKDRGYREWQRREFFQAVPLPADVDADKVEATYRNGVLSVTLPKTEQGKGRWIEVKG